MLFNMLCSIVHGKGRTASAKRQKPSQKAAAGYMMSFKCYIVGAVWFLFIRNIMIGKRF
jgi:hypothetical protein